MEMWWLMMKLLCDDVKFVVGLWGFGFSGCGCGYGVMIWCEVGGMLEFVFVMMLMVVGGDNVVVVVYEGVGFE